MLFASEVFFFFSKKYLKKRFMEEILRHVSMDYYVITIILNFVFLKMDISSRNVATEFEVLALSQENLGMK